MGQHCGVNIGLLVKVLKGLLKLGNQPLLGSLLNLATQTNAAAEKLHKIDEAWEEAREEPPGTWLDFGWNLGSKPAARIKLHPDCILLAEGLVVKRICRSV